MYKINRDLFQFFGLLLFVLVFHINAFIFFLVPLMATLYRVSEKPQDFPVKKRRIVLFVYVLARTLVLLFMVSERISIDLGFLHNIRFDLFLIMALIPVMFLEGFVFLLLPLQPEMFVNIGVGIGLFVLHFIGAIVFYLAAETIFFGVVAFLNVVTGIGQVL